MIGLKREMALLGWHQAKVELNIRLIVDAVGELGDSIVAHEFKSASFALPTACDFCHQTIWGMSKAGLSCKACGYQCHVKCQPKVVPKCTGVKSLLQTDKRKSWTNQDSSNHLLQGALSPNELGAGVLSQDSAHSTRIVKSLVKDSVNSTGIVQVSPVVALINSNRIFNLPRFFCINLAFNSPSRKCGCI